jgi:hypothetical protein
MTKFAINRPDGQPIHGTESREEAFRLADESRLAGISCTIDEHREHVLAPVLTHRWDDEVEEWVSSEDAQR